MHAPELCGMCPCNREGVHLFANIKQHTQALTMYGIGLSPSSHRVQLSVTIPIQACKFAAPWVVSAVNYVSDCMFR
jgi:hypothetical protein